MVDKKFGEASVAPIAGLLTTFLRKIIPLLTRYDCTLLLINQLRANLLNPYVKSRPGGNALKFYDSLTIYFDIGDPIDFLGNTINKSVENPAGNIIRCWNLFGIYPSNIDWGAGLDYSSGDACEITTVFKYDLAIKVSDSQTSTESA